MAGWLSVCPPESASAVTSSGHRDARRPSSACSAVISPRRDQLAEESRRRRRQELRGHLDARDLGDDPVRRHDPARAVAVDAADAVADHRQRQVEVGRRLDQPHAAAEVEVDDRRLEVRLVRAVDQVEAVGGRSPEGPPEPVDRRARPPCSGRPAAPKKPSMPAAAHRLDELDRADAVGHRAGQIGIADAVLGAEGRVPQSLRPACGQVADDPVRPAGAASGSTNSGAPARSTTTKGSPTRPRRSLQCLAAGCGNHEECRSCRPRWNDPDRGADGPRPSSFPILHQSAAGPPRSHLAPEG